MRARQFRGRARQGGFTLIELGFVLVVVMLLIAVVAIAFTTQRDRAEVKLAVDGINGLYLGAADWQMSRPNYTGVSCTVLVAQGRLPAILGNCSASNPWGGNYTVAANASNAARVDITLTSVPSGPGAQLVDKLTPIAAATPTYTAGTFTVTF
jgi:type II secretory pathway pseudopilin PulG